MTVRTPFLSGEKFLAGSRVKWPEKVEARVIHLGTTTEKEPDAPLRASFGQ